MSDGTMRGGRRRGTPRTMWGTAAGIAAALGAAACQPRVVVEAPKDPIVINMNIKIEHEIRVKVDKDLDQLFANEKDLF